MRTAMIAVAEARAVKGTPRMRSGRAERTLDCAARRQGYGYAVSGQLHWRSSDLAYNSWYRWPLARPRESGG